MKRIKRKSDARELAEKLVSEGFTIQLWDDMNSNRLMFCEGATEYCHRYNMLLSNTVSGIEWHEEMSIHTITEALWCSRKFINNSGQLDRI